MTSTMPATHRAKSRRRARLAVTASVLVLLAAAGWLADVAWNALFGKHVVADSCQVVGESTGTVYSMDPEQLLNASIIADVAMRRRLPDRAVLVALATAVQESKLRNLDYGDSDSVGLFQQRPSQGWGTREQILVPTYAAGKFFDALVKVPGWQTLSVARAAQAVQHSAFPDAYGSWEPRATALSAALTGQTTGQLTCRLGHPGLAVTKASDASSSSAPSTPASPASAASVLAAAGAAATTGLHSDLGITSATVTPAGRKQLAISVAGVDSNSTDVPDEHRATTVAAWAIAHAATDGVTSVVLGNQEWRPDRDGWHPAKHPSSPDTVVLTLSVR